MNTKTFTPEMLTELIELLDTMDNEMEECGEEISNAKAAADRAEDEARSAVESAHEARNKLEMAEATAQDLRGKLETAQDEATDSGDKVARVRERLAQMRQRCDEALQSMQLVSSNITAAIDEIDEG